MMKKTFQKKASSDRLYSWRLACQEHSTRSRQAWLESLHSGCLNKDSSLALRYYSHLKALSSRQFRGSSICQYQSNSPCEDVCTDQAPHNDSVSSSETNPFYWERLSPVLLEDLSRPPSDIVETPPVFMTTTEFFNYLSSDQWTKEICCRVIGGELLSHLLCSLCFLESHYYINSHVVYTYLNNQKLAKKGVRPAHKLGEETATVPRISLDLPLPYQTDEKMVFEKLGIRLVFYDKSDISAIPYLINDDIPQQSDSGLVRCLPKVHNVLQLPCSQRAYLINNIRLPPQENLSDHIRIGELEEELEQMQAVKDEKQAPPVLVEAKSKEKGREGETLKTDLKNSQATDAKKSQEVESSAVEYFATDSHFLEPTCTLFTSKWGVVSKYVFNGQLKNVFRDKARRDYSVDYSSLMSDFWDQEDQLRYEKLQLTCNELYLTGLYYPRIHNREGVEQKLQRLKLARRENRLRKQAVETGPCPEASPVRGRRQRKVLPPLKRLTGYKTASHPRPPPATGQRQPTPEVSALDLWSRYISQHEKTEMDTALKNDCERGILERLRKSMDNKQVGAENPGLSDAKNVKPKGKRNVSANKGYDKYANTCEDPSDGNLSALGFGTRMPKLQQGQRAAQDAAGSGNDKYSQSAKANKGEGTTGTTLSLLRMLSQWRETVDDGVHFQPATPTDNSQAKYAGMKNFFYEKDKPTTAENALTGDVSSNQQPSGQNTASGHSRPKKASQSFPGSLSARNRNLSRAASGQTDKKVKMSIQTVSSSVGAKNDISDLSAHGAESPDSVSGEDSFPSAETSSTSGPEPPHITRGSEALKLRASQAKALRCQCFSTECCCQECLEVDWYLDSFRLEEGLQSQIEYPLKLGQLRRTFGFLEKKDHIPQLEVGQLYDPKALAKWECSDVADRILNLINDVMIRKEILTSSVDLTYTTVTFTKAGAFDKLKLY